MGRELAIQDEVVLTEKAKIRADVAVTSGVLLLSLLRIIT